MELPATGVPLRLTAEQVREQARQRWFNTIELCEIFAKHDTLNIHISQPQERPTNGAFFAIHMQRLRKFRKDGHVWAKKKDNKTIQESHENLKVGGVVMLNCLYAYGEAENNFQRRIYRMIKKEHGDIVIFHYRKIENQENRKIWRRGVEAIIVTPQSIQQVGKVIPTLAVAGISSGIVDHSSNQLSLPPQTANTSNLNIQENVESSGCSSDIVDHSSNQLPLPPQTADTGNQNSIHANAQPSSSSFGIVNHENYQLPLPPNTADSSNQSNIQGHAESADIQQDLMQIKDAELSGIVNHDNYQLPLAPKTADTGNQNHIQANAQPSDAEEVREQAQQRWFNTTELCEIFAKRKTLNIHISQRQERLTNGAFLAIDLLREFKKDGHVWAKKDGKTIQESHENLKVDGGEMLNRLYAYGETENNFQRRIYRMIKNEHGDVVLFHYREDKNHKNRKIWRRSIKTIKVTSDSIQETGIVIPTLAVTGFPSGIVDHSVNQLSLPPQTANTSNLNIQENVESTGYSSGIVNHDNYQLPLAPKTADTGNQNSIQANAQPSGSSFGIVNHENYQVPLPSNTTDSSNQSNIQGNVESADIQQDLMQITDAEFSGIVNRNNYQLPLAPKTAHIGNQNNIRADVQSSRDDMLHYDYEFENQSFPQETKNDFFTNPGTPGSLGELPDLMMYKEPSSERNKKNLKRGKEILGELPANSFGEEYQDHMNFQQNPELQEDWNNCKCRKKLHILAMPCSLPGAVHHNIQGSAASGGIPSKKEIESDFSPNPGIPVRPCELLELIKNVEQFLEFIFPAVDPTDYFGDITNESLLKRFENMLSLSSVHPSCHDSNMTEILLEKKFRLWLQEKASECENGITVLDEGGAGVIHLAAGLGYDWAIEALIVDAKIDINFTDKNGCTALHWAAYCGRKNTVEFLISKDAAHALPSFPPGSGENTPADLAFATGHQKIGHYLKEK